MTAADWDIVIKAGAALMTSVVIPWAIVAYQARTGVQVTDQQRAAIYHALDTAKGQVETLIDQGKLARDDVSPLHPIVQAMARSALARVPDAVAAQGVSVDSAAEIIVGRVDTTPKPPVIVIPQGNAVPLVAA